MRFVSFPGAPAQLADVTGCYRSAPARWWRQDRHAVSVSMKFARWIDTSLSIGADHVAKSPIESQIHVVCCRRGRPVRALSVERVASGEGREWGRPASARVRWGVKDVFIRTSDALFGSGVPRQDYLQAPCSSSARWSQSTHIRCLNRSTGSGNPGIAYCPASDCSVNSSAHK